MATGRTLVPGDGPEQGDTESISVRRTRTSTMLSGGFPVPLVQPDTCEHSVSIVKGTDSSLGTALT